MSGPILIRVGSGGRPGSAVDPNVVHPSFYVDEFSSRRGEELGRDLVEGTKGERLRWQAAGRAYRKVISDAAVRLYRVRRRTWLLRLPGGRRRLERAEAEYRKRTVAATEVYRPVYEEIERRLEAGRAERERRTEEWQRQRLEEEVRKRAVRERYAEVGEKAVWGWSVTGKGAAATARVFRHDVPAFRAPPLTERQSEQPLNARALEEALLGLSEDGVTVVEWEATSCRAVVDECSVPGTRASFGQWWSAVTSRHWPSPEEPPRPPRPLPGGSAASSGSSHHGSHGSHGDAGGGDHGGGGYGGSGGHGCGGGF
ncbi:hypothetical protein ABZX75_30385 [Streptomyces sp. NPDC003038]|uniref:hypothetical protein n=1 Tax=unclassified Streptomyces TaxID=2593676 RepID=UPI0033BD07CE